MLHPKLAVTVVSVATAIVTLVVVVVTVAVVVAVLAVVVVYESRSGKFSVIHSTAERSSRTACPHRHKHTVNNH